MKRLEMSSADLSEADLQAVMAVLQSGRIALGPKTVEFETEIAKYCGVKHAVAVNSGTAALHLLVKSLEIGPGDEVLVPSFTFAASVNCILYEGATPVFVDIEPETYNLDPADLEAKITPKTKAIMAVDVFGHPVEWDAINAIAQKHRLAIIDDSCEALGAEYHQQKIGRFGDAAAFAFYPNKQMTTGEGGIVVTNQDRIASLCRSMRNQGRGEMGAWLEHERLGYNYRISEMQAALGVSQLKRLETFLAKREQVAGWYTERLRKLDFVRPPVVKPGVRMSWFVYVITLRVGLQRDAVISFLEKEGIPSRGYFAPIHAQKYLEAFPQVKRAPLPVTESVAERTIALPFYNNLPLEEVEYVVEVLGRYGER
ncbi:MAG TPA: DegT/DnrJ/EryC1/StrS family aminotransferase [Bacillota bacterium]|nr:DegT/DnrJ/EryC1/StrS family aminotransferase [Bacillota bacterium]